MHLFSTVTFSRLSPGNSYNACLTLFFLKKTTKSTHTHIRQANAAVENLEAGNKIFMCTYLCVRAAKE